MNAVTRIYPNRLTTVLVCGGPRVGKTTLARRLAQEHGLWMRSTDDLVGTYEWSEASEEVARWLCEPGPWIVEGVCSVRAARKFMAAHPDGLPAAHVLWLETPRVERTKGQVAMGRGCATVWAGILPALMQRGAQIFTDTQGGPL